jgi:hypothetical protein
LLGDVVVVLLVHPPNSSSAATLGANPPEAPGTIGLLASEAQPRSLDVEVVAGFAGSAGAGSGVAQALPPQTSDPPAQALEVREPRGLVVEGLGWERLNTEVVVVVVVVEVAVAGVRDG